MAAPHEKIVKDLQLEIAKTTYTLYQMGYVTGLKDKPNCLSEVGNKEADEYIAKCTNYMFLPGMVKYHSKGDGFWEASVEMGAPPREVKMPSMPKLQGKSTRNVSTQMNNDDNMLLSA